jgi:hypothetical protein
MECVFNFFNHKFYLIFRLVFTSKTQQQNFYIIFLCYSYHTCSYNQYINQLMHLIKYTLKYKTCTELLHVLALKCHHQGFILTKECKASMLNTTTFN